MSDNNNEKSEASLVLNNQNIDKLQFKERAILAIEAEHINSILKKDPIFLKSFKKKLLSLPPKMGGTITDEKINLIFNQYNSIRNYLNHTKHTDSKIKLDYELCDVLCKLYEQAYIDRKVSASHKQLPDTDRKASAPHKQLPDIDERFFSVEEEKFFKKSEGEDKYFFTLLGVIMFLCMNLEKDRAYQLRDKFDFTNSQKEDAVAVALGSETESQQCSINEKEDAVAVALDSVIQKYSRKKVHKIIDSNWDLFVEILDYIRKPIEHSPNYENDADIAQQKNNGTDKKKSKKKKFDKRTKNKYVMDNFIIKWIELGEKLPELKFAKTKKVERIIKSEKRREDKIKITKIPYFTTEGSKKKDDIDEYFRINDMYWCKIKDNDESQKYIDFKMHRVHLQRLAKKILEGKEDKEVKEVKDVIISSMLENIKAVKEFNEEYTIPFDAGVENSLTLKSSLPRSAKRELEDPPELEAKIKKRIEYYDNLLKKPPKEIHGKMQFILWALQRPLWNYDNSEGKNILKIDKITYQNISKALCYYSVYDITDVQKQDEETIFQKQVKSEIPEKCKYLRDYIKDDIVKTFKYVVKAAKKELETDKEILLEYSSKFKKEKFFENKEEELFTKHSLRFTRTKKDTHPVLQRIKEPKKHPKDYRNIIWLSKHWGLSDYEQKERTSNPQEIKLFYHQYIQKSRGVNFHPENYHYSLQKDENENFLQLDKTIIKEKIKDLSKKDQEIEKEKLYDALIYYENDRLLLEIATRCIDDNNSDPKSNLYFKLEKSFDLSCPSSKVIIKENKNSLQPYHIPLRYLKNLSLLFREEDFIKGIKLINEGDTAILPHKKPNGMGNIGYFMQIVLPTYKSFSTAIIQVLLEIESRILSREENSKENIDLIMRNSLLDEFDNNKKDYISFNEMLNFITSFSKLSNVKEREFIKKIIKDICNNGVYEDFVYMLVCEKCKEELVKIFIKYIRNNVAHQDLGNLLVSGAYKTYINSVDNLTKLLKCDTKKVTELIESYKSQKKKQNEKE